MRQPFSITAPPLRTTTGRQSVLSPSTLKETPIPAPPMALTSSAFEHGGEIPLRHGQRAFQVTVTVGGKERLFTCLNPPESANISPPLSWTNVPVGAGSLVLTMVDNLSLTAPDLPAGLFFAHWLVYNIPPTATGLPEGVPNTSLILTDGAMQGRNHYPEPYHLGYGGPCSGREKHCYIFTLYALDTVLDLEPGADHETLIRAMKGHILARAELRGYFGGD